MGKGEIARHEQFLLFPQCFQKASFPEVSKGVIVWEWVNCWGERVPPQLTDYKNEGLWIVDSADTKSGCTVSAIGSY